MKQNIEVRIRAVSNGFIVEACVDYNRSGAYPSDTNVFESIEGLLAFVSKHFKVEVNNDSTS